MELAHSVHGRAAALAGAYHRRDAADQHERRQGHQ
jgi:hypothetical protein